MGALFDSTTITVAQDDLVYSAGEPSIVSIIRRNSQLDPVNISKTWNSKTMEFDGCIKQQPTTDK